MLHTLDRREFLVGGASAMVLGRASVCAAQAQLSRITIGANPAGTNFNVIAGGFAKHLQQSLGLPSIVRPYSGSSVYVPLLQRGEITLGINSSIDSYLSFTGRAPYPAAMTNLRALMAVYPLGYMYWVRAKSEIYRIEDLRDQRVVINYRGLVVLDQLNRAILATGGLTDIDIRGITAAGLPEGARNVLEGRADAVAMGYRLPLVKQMHVAIAGGLRFLNMGADEARVSELMPSAWVTTISPGPSDVGMDGPTRVAMYDTYLNAGVHVSNDDAYKIVASLQGEWQQLQKTFVLLSSVSVRQTVPANNPHPYHACAVAYYRDAGLWTDAHQRNQDRLLTL